MNADATQYTFQLRQGVTFHDGTPFDGEAVKFTFDRIVNPDMRAQTAISLMGPYARADVLGEHEVRIVFNQGEFQEVVSTMRNFIPMRHVRGYEGMVRMPAEDGTVALVEFASGAHGMLQTSYVAVGNYPGIDMRVYGSKGAAIARLVTEDGVAETLHFATPDQVEFRAVHLPSSHFPPGTTVKTPWAELYYRNLIRLWVDEILDDRPEECTFHDGAKSDVLPALRQEVRHPLDGGHQPSPLDIRG